MCAYVETFSEFGNLKEINGEQICLLSQGNTKHPSTAQSTSLKWHELSSACRTSLSHIIIITTRSLCIDGRDSHLTCQAAFHLQIKFKFIHLRHCTSICVIILKSATRFIKKINISLILDYHVSKTCKQMLTLYYKSYCDVCCM